MSTNPHEKILSLTTEIYELVDRINKKGQKNIGISGTKKDIETGLWQLTPTNIQKLLVDLNLGLNYDFNQKTRKLDILHQNSNMVSGHYNMVSSTEKDEYLLDIKFLEGQIDYCTKTKAKFFSDIWFSLSEQGQNSDLVPSLWDLDKKMVLDELKEILKEILSYYLENLK